MKGEQGRRCWPGKLGVRRLTAEKAVVGRLGKLERRDFRRRSRRLTALLEGRRGESQRKGVWEEEEKGKEKEREKGKWGGRKGGGECGGDCCGAWQREGGGKGGGEREWKG